MKIFLFFAFDTTNPNPRQALIITGLSDKREAKEVALENTPYRIMNVGWTFHKESKVRARAIEICPQNILCVNVIDEEKFMALT